MRARLVPLNKVYPRTPKVSEYRPIVITSPIIKFLEQFIRDDLTNYAKTQLHQWQFGFIPGVGI
jgi:hypothetical protein